MRTITLNAGNLIPSQYTNKFEYKFPSAQTFEAGDGIAISGLNVYYSNFNILSSLGNNSIRLFWPQAVGVNYTTYVLTIPDGMYDIISLNNWLQFEMINRRMYLIDSNGDFTFYAEIISNFNYYKFQINTYQVPASLPVGYAQPTGGFLNFSAANLHPRIEIPATSIRTTLGFDAGIYPPSGTATATPYSILSQNTPQITDQTTFLVRCSLCENKFATGVNDIIYAYAPNKEYGSLLSLNLNKYIFNSIKPGIYSIFTIELLDQNFNPLRLIDPNCLLTVVIWRRGEDGELE